MYRRELGQANFLRERPQQLMGSSYAACKRPHTASSICTCHYFQIKITYTYL